MMMDVGPRGGIGYDSDTHRAGTDWDKDGSIGMGDGAMSMLVMDHLTKEEGADPMDQPTVQKARGNRKESSSIGDWMKSHYLLITAVVTFAIVFLFLMATR